MTAPMLERRRIEAEILALVYDEVKSEFGADAAQRVIAGAVRKSANRAASSPPVNPVVGAPPTG